MWVCNTLINYYHYYLTIRLPINNNVPDHGLKLGKIPVPEQRNLLRTLPRTPRIDLIWISSILKLVLRGMETGTSLPSARSVNRWAMDAVKSIQSVQDESSF